MNAATNLAIDLDYLPRKALERLVGDGLAALTLQRQGEQNIGRVASNWLHDATASSSSTLANAPSSHPKDVAERVQMSRHSKEIFFRRDEHLARIATALDRRMYPATPLHNKVLGDAIGVTARTIGNWRRGKCDPGTFEFRALCDFFERAEGAPAFRCEVYGDDIGLAMARRAMLAKRMVDAAEELKAMEG